MNGLTIVLVISCAVLATAQMPNIPGMPGGGGGAGMGGGFGMGGEIGGGLGGGAGGAGAGAGAKAGFGFGAQAGGGFGGNAGGKNKRSIDDFDIFPKAYFVGAVDRTQEINRGRRMGRSPQAPPKGPQDIPKSF